MRSIECQHASGEPQLTMVHDMLRWRCGCCDAATWLPRQSHYASVACGRTVALYIEVYNIRIREQQCHRRPNSNDALLTPKKSCRCPCTRNGDRILKVLTRVYADAYRMKAFIQQAP